MNETWDLKYRPKEYSELLPGNEDAIKQLQGEPVRSYILHGPSGTGKSTSSRIFAKEINAEVYEYDAASLGKEDIENIKVMAQHISMFNPYKIIILDEAHTLSNQAKDALLKALEEGNDKTVWLLCTTELHKIAEALQTRSRIIELKRTGSEAMLNHLIDISTKEGYDIPVEELKEIVFFADGKVRQAVKLTETRCTTGVLTLPNTQNDSVRLLNAVYSEDMSTINDITNDFTNNDVFSLIKVLSDFMIAFAIIVNSQGKKTMEEVVVENTGISPTLVDNLRDLQRSIATTIDNPNVNGPGKIINRMYVLMDELMKNYNNFGDNRYNIKATLVWYSSQLEIWRKEGR